MATWRRPIAGPDAVERMGSLPHEDRGTLAVGAPADVAVRELRDGMFEFVDNHENRRTGL